MNKTSVALLVDGENVAPAHMQSIIDRVRLVGDPVVRCVFGDFSEGRLSEWPRTAREFGVEIVFQPSAGRGKNSTDIAMTIRAMDLLHEKACGIFCLASSDRDFVPLAQRLTRSGRQVYCFGRAAAKTALKPVCTNFFPLEDAPSKTTSVPSLAAEPGLPEGADTVEHRLSRFLEGEIDGRATDGWIALTTLGSAIHLADHKLAKDVGGGKLQRTLKKLECAEIVGSGQSLKVRLKPRNVVAIRAA